MVIKISSLEKNHALVKGACDVLNGPPELLPRAPVRTMRDRNKAELEPATPYYGGAHMSSTVGFFHNKQVVVETGECQIRGRLQLPMYGPDVFVLTDNGVVLVRDWVKIFTMYGGDNE